MPQPDADTAAIVLIGDELLSGKVTDANGAYMIRELRRLGVTLTELHVVPDTLDRIAEILELVRHRNTYVFTSGGVGPTHDDRTMEAVARAVGEPLEERPELVGIIREHFGADPDTPWLKMASIPASCELLHHPSTRWPAYKVHNIYVLPGIPEIFQRQFNQVRAALDTGDPFLLRVLYLAAGEGDIAHPLTAAAERFPDVAFGSYPVWDHPEYRTRVTIEATDEGALSAASRALHETFAEHIVKVADGDGRI